jgi:hypothetical protein
VSLRFFAGGGQPPRSHEVLRLAPDGNGVYLTGMPWPEQPPFDEIGVYAAASADAPGLAALARAALSEGAGPRHADTGGESITLDGAEASWSPRDRGPATQALVDAARAVIADARTHPLAVVRADLRGGQLTLSHRGERPLRLALTSGELHAGWGPAGHPPSPLRLAFAPSVEVTLPERLTPGATVALDVPAREPVDEPEFATPYVLLGLRWRPEVPDEPDALAGWLIAGPG